jgi:serine/threonine protein kinase
VTNPIRARVEPTAFRCSTLSRSARSSAIPAPIIARVAIMNANSGRVSWISFTQESRRVLADRQTAERHPRENPCLQRRGNFPASVPNPREMCGGAVTAKIIDLGLAKPASDAPAEAAISTPGAFAGTPEFASPEQFAGVGVDIRSDLYSWSFYRQGSSGDTSTSSAAIVLRSRCWVAI